MINYERPDDKSALDAKFHAHQIVFGPMVFQAAVALRDFGILDLVMDAKNGISEASLSEETNISSYGMRVLLEVALSSGIFRLENGLYKITKTGYFLLKDDLTRVNMNFVNDVCYKGMAHLKESIRHGYPAGLKEFGDHETIYQVLANLPEKARKSWFDFDHYYSDISFPVALPKVFKTKPRHIIDIGGNTGKWAIKCAQHDPNVNITIIDLPGQLELARKNIADAELQGRVSLQSVDMLREKPVLPADTDIIWMSQFLDCFSEQEIVGILNNLRNATDKKTSIYIMEIFLDHQRFEAAAYSLHNISLYFTVFANGNSRMYRSSDLLSCLDQAGLSVVEENRDIGVIHTLWRCVAI